MDQNELKYWLGISAIEAIGPRRFVRILSRFKPAASFFQASLSDLINVGFSLAVAQKIVADRARLDLDFLVEQLIEEGIRVIDYQDEEYPALLKEIYDYPPLLYIRGQLAAADKFSIAVVGSRKPTIYGQQTTAEIVRGLVANQVTVISGLAFGIDSIAHQATLAAGGRTIAVLGTGLDWHSVYPAANRNLIKEIVAAGGAIISEFPCGMPGHRQNFPQRNRLISGLGLGTVVVEAAEDSGALITAQSALDQNREVFALPGSIYSPNSVGPNNLIKQGAKLITGAGEILEALNLGQVKNYITNRQVLAETPTEAVILSLLSKEPVHIDELVAQSGLIISVVNSVLVMMEMKGKVKNLGNQMYVST
ncbi:MAG: DNA-processing protein DprA [Patescibacteria group bacterium]